MQCAVLGRFFCWSMLLHTPFCFTDFTGQSVLRETKRRISERIVSVNSYNDLVRSRRWSYSALSDRKTLFRYSFINRMSTYSIPQVLHFVKGWNEIFYKFALVSIISNHEISCVLLKYAIWQCYEGKYRMIYLSIMEFVLWIWYYCILLDFNV